MHAIVRQGDGKYYVSPVFGYYGEHLIKWFAMQPNTKYLIPQILIVESSQENWIADEDGVATKYNKL